MDAFLGDSDINVCNENLINMTVFHFLRKDEAANRPKVEFVPKSLADLNIEGVTDGLNGTHIQNNFTNHHSNHHSSSTNISGGYQFKRPAPKTVPLKQTQSYTPDPFDPWSFPQGILFLFFIF